MSAAAPRSPLRVLLGALALVAGIALAAHLLLGLVAPGALLVPLVPLFDRLRQPDDGLYLALAGAAALLLLVSGWLVLTRRRLAPLVFLAAGWGGLVLTLIAIQPGEHIEGKMRMALRMAERSQGPLPAGTTFYDLIPDHFYWAAGAFLALWVVLLVTASVHFARQRALYDRPLRG